MGGSCGTELGSGSLSCHVRIFFSASSRAAAEGIMKPLFEAFKNPSRGGATWDGPGSLGSVFKSAGSSVELTEAAEASGKKVAFRGITGTCGSNHDV